MNWQIAGGSGSPEDKLGFVRSMTRPYDGARRVFPAAGTAGRQYLHRGDASGLLVDNHGYQEPKTIRGNERSG